MATIAIQQRVSSQLEIMFSQKSFRITQDDKFFSKLLSRDSFRVNSSSRVFYYGEAPGAVPFVWESQPGTPIHGKSMLADLDEDTAYLPPLTPPPSYYSGSLSGMTPNVMHKKKSRPKVILCAIFSKLTTKKAHMTLSPSRSSASLSQSSSSSSSNWLRSYSTPSASITGYSRSRFCVRDFDTAPAAMDYYMARNMTMLRQRESYDKQSWFGPVVPGALNYA